MKTKADLKISLETIIYLPSFAQYLLQHRLKDFVAVQMQFSNEVELPMMKFFKNFSEEQLYEISKASSIEFLTNLAENKSRQQIDNSIKQWKENQLPIINKADIAAEDITLVIYLRKKTLTHFIPDFVAEIDKAIELIKEIDLFLVESETAFTNTYIDLLKERISENAYLVETVNNTIPGAVYVFDIKNFKGIYSNNKLADIIGYNHEELNLLGENALEKLLHPDDKEKMKKHFHDLKHAKDGEIKILRYRVKDKQGNYKWVSTNESIFKRDEKGNVLETIGITLDIDKEQQVTEALQKNEKLYKQAEAITHLGSYTWDLTTNELKWSDELYRIYGLEPSEDSTEFEYISSFNNPEDTPEVRREYSNAIKEKKPFDFYYRINAKNGGERILHARGNLIPGADGGPGIVLGTVQDETEKQTLIKKLQQTESVYKQAEELANMGNWSWDVKSDKLNWTDQLYKIYGLEPQSEQITIERFLEFVHPGDIENIKAGVDEIYREDILDYTFRIFTKDGKEKIIRSVAQVQRNEKGDPIFVVGTERDITEKQNLIDKLKKSEKLYKQAQSLAHVGNWSWDIASNRIEWSDELYRIYGLEPQSQNISFEEYISFIHPDDTEKITKQIELAMQQNQSLENTHRLIRKDGNVRIVSATGEVMTDENGKPYMMIGTAQDVTERQTLINKLQEGDKLFKQAQSLAHLGNWTMDLRSREFIWSNEMFNIYEIARNEKFTFDDWITFLDPEEKDDLIKYFEECVREQKLYDKVQKIILRNGKRKTIHRKGEFLFDENGAPVKMIGTTQDVTEEYRIQQELKDNQTFIRKITDATPSIIASYNVNTGKYVFISGGLEKLLGYNSKDVMEQGVGFFVNVIHPDDAIEIMDKNAKALEDANNDPDKNDLVVEFTYRMKHKNGYYRWFHTYGTIFDRNNKNKVDHVLNISLDVTEQIEASQKIKEQEHFIQQIADSSPTILYLYNVKTQSMEYINREIFFVLGYLPEEVIEAGPTVTQLLYHPEDYRLLPSRKESGISFQQVDSMIQYECRMKNKDEEWRWFLVREIVFKTDENGNVRQVLGAALDINRRKDMEKTILQNTLLLEQSNASLEEFAYVASHDLKEPLRKISTFGDRLLASQLENLAPDGKIYLQKIVEVAQRMQIMINDLLSISMISNNTSFENFSLQKILNETLQTLEFKIEQQNAIITSDVLPEAKIIPSQMRQLFQNLLSNSLKFVQDGVQPVIIIRHFFLNAEDAGQYQLAPSNNYHKIEFSDNGIGFENEYAGKIFAIFQRLHGRSEYEGSGIGLAICKKIAEHHGGVIYATGVPGVGATITVIFPA